MAGNPQIAQGTLNRLRATVVITDHPELNVTPGFLDDAGISLAFEGETTTFLRTLTGNVTSPEPFQMIMLRVALVKSQALAALYEARRQSLATIGDVVVTPDAAQLPKYTLTNCAIENVAELSFNGRQAGYVVSIKGYYIINNDLWAAG